jgi:hypothetical protein
MAKGEAVAMLNKVLRREDVLGNGGMATPILNFGTRWGMQ